MRAIAIWICCCAYLNCVGWTLSAIHQLNPAGYAVALVIGLAWLLAWQKRASARMLPQIHWRKLRRRFRRPLPAIYLIVAVLVFLGGAWYAPNNYDALTYRLPRTLNWLAAGHWFWIPTINDRMNYSTTAWEWLAAPFFAVLHSDRGLFLINVAGFLLLPGLLFSVFRQTGVSGKVARAWMWVLPLAYGYATQAGGVGNDLSGAVFALASVHFGLRARRSGRVEEVWLAGLAAALMTGTKLSNLPLLLPCLVAVWPALGALRKRWAAGIAIVAAGVLVSAVPTIVLNQLNTGRWTGDPQNLTEIQVKSPSAALLGNGLLLLQQSFMPPALPGARKINSLLDEKMPASWQHTLKEKFPRYYLSGLKELPQEEEAGLGLGVTLLLLAGTMASVRGVGRKKTKANLVSPVALVGYAAWAAALFYMFKMGSEATARLMLPYYPLAVIPLLLLPGQERLWHCRAWKLFIALAMLSVLPAVILSPSRPLFPAQRISARLLQHHPDSAAVKRLATVYATYAHRNDPLAPLRDALPDDARKVGFVAGGNDTDYSLWRPFGRRQVVYLQAGHQEPVSLPEGLEWIVVKQTAWPDVSKVPLDEWAAAHHAEIVKTVSVATLVSWGDETWCLLRVQKP